MSNIELRLRFISFLSAMSIELVPF